MYTNHIRSQAFILSPSFPLNALSLKEVEDNLYKYDLYAKVIGS